MFDINSYRLEYRLLLRDMEGTIEQIIRCLCELPWAKT